VALVGQKRRKPSFHALVKEELHREPDRPRPAVISFSLPTNVLA
jgi:hypothetical protein